MHFIWKLCFVLVFIQVGRCQNLVGDKTSEFLKQKFSNYDKAIRPNFGGKPVQVTVSGYVLDIYDINENNQEFTISLYLRHGWKDPRLEFTEAEAGTEKILLSKEYADKIWQVDTFIVNERESRGHDLVMDNQFVTISSDGTIHCSARFTIKASCKMELGWFPFDRHTCPLVLESYGHGTADYVYQWKKDEEGNMQTAVGVSKEVSSIQFSVSAVNAKEEIVSFKQCKEISYSKLEVQFFFIRASTRYIHEVYLPAIILTCISFITLFHATGNSRTRLHLSIFIEGLVIILMALSAKTMPPVGYQTALDFYLVVCLLTITCVVIVNVAICLMFSNAMESNGAVRLRSDTEGSTNLEQDGKEGLFEASPRLSSRTSRIFTLLIKLRLCIPLLFVLFNLLYWMIVLIGSSSFPEDFLILENFNAN